MDVESTSDSVDYYHDCTIRRSTLRWSKQEINTKTKRKHMINLRKKGICVAKAYNLYRTSYEEERS